MMMDGKKHEVIRTTLAPPIRPMNADDIADAAADAAHPEWRAFPIELADCLRRTEPPKATTTSEEIMDGRIPVWARVLA